MKFPEIRQALLILDCVAFLFLLNFILIHRSRVHSHVLAVLRKLLLCRGDNVLILS